VGHPQSDDHGQVVSTVPGSHQIKNAVSGWTMHDPARQPAIFPKAWENSREDLRAGFVFYLGYV
jgi:hypothetical protein